MSDIERKDDHRTRKYLLNILLNDTLIGHMLNKGDFAVHMFYSLIFSEITYLVNYATYLYDIQLKTYDVDNGDFTFVTLECFYRHKIKYGTGIFSAKDEFKNTHLSLDAMKPDSKTTDKHEILITDTDRGDTGEGSINIKISDDSLK